MFRSLLWIVLLLVCAGWSRTATRPHPSVGLAIVVPFAARRRPEHSPFGELLDSWLHGSAPEENLAESLERTPIETWADVDAVLAFLTAMRDPQTPVRQVRRSHRALPHVVDSCLEIRDENLANAIQDRALPEATALFEESLGRRSPLSQETALTLLELLVAFDDPGMTERLVRAVRLPLLPDHLDWSRVFSHLADDHPFWPDVCDALAEPLPPGFVAIAFLDTLNDLAVAGQLDVHPFASEEGCRRLEGWLRSPHPELFSYARSAATALPFIGRRDREKLLPVARKHPDEEVRLEAAWGAAVTGDEAGIRSLADWAEDTLWSRQACQYLRELQREDAIPAVAQTPEFEAIASLTAWLAHPDQFGVRPERVDPIDQRELLWPPTGERNLIQLLRYVVEVDGFVYEGVGMVGELTFALLDEPTAELSLEDLYGLYCSWEMIYQNAPDAPPEIDAQAGRTILAQHNPDFPASGS